MDTISELIGIGAQLLLVYLIYAQLLVVARPLGKWLAALAHTCIRSVRPTPRSPGTW